MDIEILQTGREIGIVLMYVLCIYITQVQIQLPSGMDQPDEDATSVRELKGWATTDIERRSMVNLPIGIGLR